jgi:hypothetical protein
MPDFNAVMIIGHFVVSVFNVPLGQPLYQFVPFPNMEICQEHVQYQVTPQTGHQMSLEYKMYKNAQCVTREEFEAQMNAQRQQQAPVAPQDTLPDSTPIIPKGWEQK